MLTHSDRQGKRQLLDPKPVGACLMAVLVWGSLGSAAAAAEGQLRIDSAIYSGDRKEPVSRNHTLLDGEVVYDILEDNGEMTVFDRRRRKIVLIKPRERISTRITGDDLLAYSLELRRLIMASNDRLLRFCAQPKFQASRSEPYSWTFSSPVMTYHLETEKATQENVALVFRDFSGCLAAGVSSTRFVQQAVP